VVGAERKVGGEDLRSLVRLRVEGAAAANTSKSNLGSWQAVKTQS
jgi:hypothetical protein